MAPFPFASALSKFSRPLNLTSRSTSACGRGEKRGPSGGRASEHTPQKRRESRLHKGLLDLDRDLESEYGDGLYKPAEFHAVLFSGDYHIPSGSPLLDIAPV